MTATKVDAGMGTSPAREHPLAKSTLNAQLREVLDDLQGTVQVGVVRDAECLKVDELVPGLRDVETELVVCHGNVREGHHLPDARWKAALQLVEVAVNLRLGAVGGAEVREVCEHIWHFACQGAAVNREQTEITRCA
jgi:hypothetical protein